MPAQRRAVESARLELADHEVLGPGCDLRHDLVAVEIALGLALHFVHARHLPAPAAEVPAVGAKGAGRVDDREAALPGRGDERLDVRECGPSILAAGARPALDRLKDRL